jgi:hypothetical protein
MLPPKAASGTKEDPNLVPSITNKRIVGCICKYFTFIFCSLLYRVSKSCFESRDRICEKKVCN